MIGLSVPKGLTAFVQGPNTTHLHRPTNITLVSTQPDCKRSQYQVPDYDQLLFSTGCSLSTGGGTLDMVLGLEEPIVR